MIIIRELLVAICDTADRALGESHFQGVAADNCDTCTVTTVNINAVKDQLDFAFTGIDIDTSGELSCQNIAAGLCDREFSVFLVQIHFLRVICGNFSGCLADVCCRLQGAVA